MISNSFSKYKYTLRFFFASILYALFFFAYPMPTNADGACAANEYDLLEYFTDTADDVVFFNDGQAKYEYNTTINGKPGFYIIKSRNQGVYEEFTYDGQDIYHLKDTSWADHNGDIFCNNGNPAGFTMITGCPNDGSAIGQSQEGIKWAPRCVPKTGVTTYNSGPFENIGFDKLNCLPCEAPYTTLGNNPSCTSRTVSIHNEPSVTFPSGLTFTNVIRISIDSGPGSGENYWYDKEHGWIAFGRANSPASYATGFGPPMTPSLDPNPTAGGQFACHPFNGTYGEPGPPGSGPGPIINPNQCQYTEITPFRNGQYTSRPIECSTCVPNVPDPTLSCAGNIEYQKNLLFTAWETMTCGGDECSYDDTNCSILLGGEELASGNATTDQLLVGPKPWHGGFTLDAYSVILPFAGNDTEESREKYIADYIDGTTYYRTPINPSSDPASSTEDPLPIYDSSANAYFSLPPQDPRYVSYSGIVQKLAPQEYQDELKYKLLNRVDGTNYASIFQPVKDYTIGYTWGSGDEAHFTDFINERDRLRPLPETFATRDEYLTAIKNWTTLDNGRWYKLWSYVPLTSRQDSPGEFVPVIQSPARLDRVGDAGNTIAESNPTTSTTSSRSLAATTTSITPDPAVNLPPQPTSSALSNLLASSIPFSISNLLSPQPQTQPANPVFLAQVPKIEPDPNFKVAFFGDTGSMRDEFDRVIELVQREAVDLIVIEGDFNYEKNGQDLWKEKVNRFGANFPILFVQGNHDVIDGNDWNDYRTLIDQHSPNGGTAFTNSADWQIAYKGVNFVSFSEEPPGDESFLNSALGATSSQYKWNICNWHRTNNQLTVGANRSGDTGIGNYNICMQHGAMIINAHDHTYQRTKTLINMSNREVDSDPTCSTNNNLCLGPGRSFVIISGLGGQGFHSQTKCLNAGACPFWASLQTGSQSNTRNGALFITFNVGGNSNQAQGYFKTYEDAVLDSFTITLKDNSPTPTPTPTAPQSKNIRVMTYNSGYTMPDDTCQEWTNEANAKADRIANYIKQQGIEIAMIQEMATRCNTNEWVLLDQRLKAIDYTMYYAASDPDISSNQGLRTVTFAIEAFQLDQSNSRSIPVPRPNSGSRYGVSVPINVGVGPITFYNIHTHVDAACRGVNEFFSQVNNNEERILGGDFNVAFFEGGFPDNYDDCNQGTVDNVNLYNTQPQPGIDFIMLPKNQPFSFISTSKDTGSSITRDHAPVVSNIRINMPQVSITPTPTPSKLKVLLYNTERNDAAPGNDDGCTASGSNVQIDYTNRKIDTLAKYIKSNQFDILLLQELWVRCPDQHGTDFDEGVLLLNKLQENQGAGYAPYPMLYKGAPSGNGLFHVGTYIRQGLSFYDAEVQTLLGEESRHYLLTPIATSLGRLSFFNGHVSHQGSQCSNVEDFVSKFANISGTFKIAAGDINNELWRSGCAGVRANYKLVPTRPDNRGIDFLFIPNASTLNFENTSIQDLFDPGRPSGTWLSDHQPIVTYITGDPANAPSPGPSTYPTPSASPPPQPGQIGNSGRPPGADSGLGPIAAPPTPVQLQLPHVARLFESQRILNDLLSPYRPAASALTSTPTNPNPGGPTPPVIPGNPGKDIWVYNNAVHASEYSGNITDGVDDDYPLILEKPEYHYDRWNTVTFRYASRVTANININLPVTPEFAILRSATQDFPVTINGNTVHFTLPPTPGNYYLKTNSRSKPIDTIVIMVDNMDQVGAQAPAGAIVISPGEDIQGAIDAAPAGSLIFFEAGTHNVGNIVIQNRQDLDFQLHPEATINQTAGSGSIVNIFQSQNITFFGPGKIIARDGNEAVSFMVRESNGVDLHDFYHQKREHDNGFTLHIYNSDNVTVNTVRIFSGNDGTDPDSSRNVVYDNVYIESKDDGVAVKSRGSGPAENITIRNSIVKSRASALKIGKATIARAVNNIVFENTTVYDSDRGMIVDPDCQRDEDECQGSIGNVVYRNIVIRNMRGYEQGKTLIVGGRGNMYGPANIRFENIEADFIGAGHLQPGHKTSFNGFIIHASQSPAINNQPALIYIPQNNDCPRNVSNIQIDDPGGVWGGFTNHGYCNPPEAQNPTAPAISQQTTTSSDQQVIAVTGTPTQSPQKNSLVTNGAWVDRSPLAALGSHLKNLFASSEIFSPTDISSVPAADNLLAQAQVPASCLAPNLAPGCYAPSGKGCFTITMDVNPTVDFTYRCSTTAENFSTEQACESACPGGGSCSTDTTVLQYCVRAEQTCQNGGNIGDCFWQFNGSSTPMVRTIVDQPGGTYICSYYNHGGALPPEGNVGPGSTGSIEGTIRCNRDTEPSCCPQTQSISCSYQISSDGNVTSNCNYSNPAPPPPAQPVCAPTVLGTVPQCSMVPRTGPGDNLCGLQSFNVVVDAPNETFWNTNPYETMSYEDDGVTPIGPGDGAGEYSNTQCGAAVACANCTCAPPNENVNYVDPNDGSAKDRCCAPGGVNLLTGECNNAPENEVDRLCPDDDNPNCMYDDGTSACSIKPWGSTTNVVGDLALPYQELIYPTQREIHLATELPYLGTIFEETVGFPSNGQGFDQELSPTFRMLTPYRGADTTPDTVPWYAFHAGEASGTLTVINRGDPITTAINGVADRLSTPFFFPYLGGIQDATQFVRDCLTASWPNRCTPASAAQYEYLTGKTCTANFQKLSIFSGTSSSDLTNFVTNAKPPVIKLFESGINAAQDVVTAAGGADAIDIVGRWYSTNWENQLPISQYTSPAEAADAWFLEHQNKISGYPDHQLVDYWEGINEPIVQNQADMEWLAQFENRRLAMLAQINQKGCIANFSTGNPDPALWQYFQPAFDAAVQHDAAICLHEYAIDLTNPIDNNHIGRHVNLSQYLGSNSSSQDNNLPIIISETGVDENGNPNTSGWKSRLNNDVEAYLKILQQLDQHYSSYTTIRGATIFQYGLADWPSFELAPDILKAMTEVNTTPEGSYRCVTNQSNTEGSQPASLPSFQNGTTIDAGTYIGTTGNTGYPDCSTGPHLHLSLVDNQAGGTYQHPALYLNASVALTGADTGVSAYGTRGSRIRPRSVPSPDDWRWPFNSPHITQKYGSVVSSFYNFHNGIDMVSNTADKRVYAVAGGVVVYDKGRCGNSYYNRATIDHGNGLYTIYLHLAD